MKNFVVRFIKRNTAQRAIVYIIHPKRISQEHFVRAQLKIFAISLTGNIAFKTSPISSQNAWSISK